MLIPKNQQKEKIVFGPWYVSKLLTFAEWKGFVMPDRSNRRRDKNGNIYFVNETKKKGSSAKKAAPKIAPKKISKTTKKAPVKKANAKKAVRKAAPKKRK